MAHLDHPQQPLRVLWLIDSLTLGGAESLAVRFAAALDPSRVRLEVACLKRIGGNPFEAALRATGVPVHHLGARNLRDARAFLRLDRLLRLFRPDVVHAHLTYATLWGAAAARIARVPLVATLHVDPARAPAGSREAARQWFLRTAIRRGAVQAMAVSRHLRDAWADVAGVDRDRIGVVHNGIDTRRFAAGPEARAAARASLGIDPAARVVMTVCALREGKGVESLLEACALLRARRTPATLVVVGDGERAAALEGHASLLGLDGHVAWTGYRPDVEALLPAADVFALASTRDAFPTVLLEAMAAGLPVVATRTGGIPEIVEHGRTGLLVPPEDGDALVDALGDLLEAAPRGRALGEAGRARVRERFSIEAWVDALHDVYAAARGGQRGAPAGRLAAERAS